MTSQAVLRLDRLTLQNFRCFAECEIDLHPQLTVLIAENGRGKTAILDAIGIALGLFVNTVSDTQQYTGFSEKDVRLVREQGVMTHVFPTQYIAKGMVTGQSLLWSQSRQGISTRHQTSTKKADALQIAAQQLHEKTKLSSSQTILPLVAFYGAGRAWNDRLPLSDEKRELKENLKGRMAGYLACLSSSSSIQHMVAWYKDTAFRTRDSRFASELSQNLALLAAVRTATEVVLAPTGWCEVDWDFDQDKLVVEHRERGRLPLASLSDGVRNMVALVMDIARRCASLNPHLSQDAARLTPGILLIDEIDAHLHPGWQQQIVGLLCEAFPAMQIVLSTHSPHVLSTVDKESIRIIRFDNGKGWLEIPRFQTRGVESADVLAHIMGVDPIPHVQEAQWLSDYRALVQTGRHETPEGQQLWDQLLAHFGDDHPAINEVEVLRRLQTFKMERGL